MSTIKKLAGQTVIYGIGSVLPRVLNLLILLPYLTRVFDDDQGEYGIHGIMYSFAGLIIVFFTFRMETALFRFGSKDNSLNKTFSSAFTVVFGISILAMLVILWQADNIASILSKVEDKVYVQYFAFICCFDILAAIPFARLRLENKALKFSTVKVLSVLINIGVMLFLLELLPNLNLSGLTYNPEQKLGYVFIANIVGSAATLFMLSKEIAQNSWSVEKALFGKMFQYAWPLVIVGVAGIISQLSDRWLINTFFGGTQEENEISTGLYAAAAKFAVIMQLFVQAFNYAAEPFFFKQAQEKNAQQTYADVARAFTFVGSAAFLFILFYLDVLQYILDENFRVGLEVIPVLLMAYLFLGLNYNFSIWYKIKDKTKIGAIIAVIGAIISVAVNICLIPKIGIMAAAWAAFATFGSTAALSYLIGKLYYPIPYRIDKIVGIILIAVSFYFLSEYISAYFLMGQNPKLAMNSALMLIFGSVVWWWEKNFYKRILSSNN